MPKHPRSHFRSGVQSALFARSLLAGALLFSSSPGTLLSQVPLTPVPDVEKSCAAVRDTTIPRTVFPSEEQFVHRDLQCSPLDLYYGSRANHFNEARICAFAQREETNGGGSARDSEALLVLAMLFSNGDGVARNTPLAKRFACEDEDAGTDMEAILGTIQSGRKLDLCHGGVSYGRSPLYYCIEMAQERVRLALEVENAKAKMTLPPAVWEAWNALDRAHAAFAAAHEDEESGGTAGIAVTNASNNEEADEEWLRDLKSIESGTVPTGVQTAGDFAAVDADLNSSYKNALENATTNCGMGMPCPEAIRTAERAWLRYREAWVKLAALR